MQQVTTGGGNRSLGKRSLHQVNRSAAVERVAGMGMVHSLASVPDQHNRENDRTAVGVKYVIAGGQFLDGASGGYLGLPGEFETCPGCARPPRRFNNRPRHPGGNEKSQP